MNRISTQVVIDMPTGQVLSEKGFWYAGPLALCKGGGGSSGQVSYPAYMETLHGSWLDEIDVLITSISASNPYANPGLAAYDPTNEINEAIAAYETFDAEMATFTTGDWTTDWDTLSDFAQAYFESNLGGSTELTALEAARDVRQEAHIARTVSRYAGGMADIGAVNSSSFVVGIGLIEQEHLRDIDFFGAQLALGAYKEKLNFIAQGVESMKSVTAMRLEAFRTSAAMCTELKRIAIVAGQEYIDKELIYDVQSVLWGLEPYQYGGNMLSAISGGLVENKGASGMNRLASTLGGGLGAAASGAMVGAMVGGPPGALIGGGIGLVLGAGAGYAGS